MNEKLKSILEHSKKSLSLTELFEKMQVGSVREKEEVLKALKEGVKSYHIYCSPTGKYNLMSKTSFKKGYFHGGKYGNGKVSLNGKEFWIDEKQAMGAVEGDYVLFDPIYHKKAKHHSGKVVAIMKRDLETVMGEVALVNEKAYIRPDQEGKKRLVMEILNSEGLVDGHKVVVKVKEELTKNYYQAELLKVIGHKNDPDMDVKMIAYRNGIENEFNQDVLRELSKVPTTVTEEEKKHRVDLTGEEIFTMDGDDTKDIDDAISLRKLENGNYLLGVHIADVSYYVKEGTALYQNAYERGTSVYLSDFVIPMIPHVLSNGICSLNPGVDRLALSCMMELDKEGVVVQYEVKESVIRSRKKMTYRAVNEILEKDHLVEGYEPYQETLKEMQEVSALLRKKRRNRGCSELDRPELKFVLNEEGKPVEIIKREQHTAEKIIEDFMICANECVARMMTKNNFPFLYRTHGDPDIDGINNYLKLLSFLGYEMNLNLKDTNPQTIQKIADFIQDKKEATMLKNQLLRQFDKAVYSPCNEGHSGLASICYTHFTSPIRRFPDLTVHQLIRDFIFQKKQEKTNFVAWQQKLPKIAEQSSTREKTADRCERDVLAMHSAMYMMNHIGETFEGMITNVNEQGFSVQLDNLIEGVVKSSDLEENYLYDDYRQCYVSKNTNSRYRLGDCLQVSVKHVSKNNREIQFGVVKQLTEEIETTNSNTIKQYKKGAISKQTYSSHKKSHLPPYRNQRY